VLLLEFRTQRQLNLGLAGTEGREFGAEQPRKALLVQDFTPRRQHGFG
jgi:hypothetical protein